MGGGTHERLYGFHSLPLRVLDSLERVHCTDSRLTAGELVKQIIGKAQDRAGEQGKLFRITKNTEIGFFLSGPFFARESILSYCQH